MRLKFGESELIQLTDNEAPYQHAINMDKLNAAMQETNSEIDAYIGSRYPLPLQVMPPFLVNISFVTWLVSMPIRVILAENHPIKARYDASIKTLTKISKGELTLGGSPAEVHTCKNYQQCCICYWASGFWR